ncbi:FAD-dependent monooxygenase [Thioclava litoralis]|uniref:FAD-dependent monooxygenase n=1 Tax=Thioclava litoralis TaxID=3076557 RepID=A0ABZ1DY87_9RHOB|nr:FAD-dependent monooxygenase [Thioclava sp. FTW29]
MLVGREFTILGAGISGLALARALAMHGARVTVLEQAPELAEVGAGLQISPNGMRVIEALGLGAGLCRTSPRLQAVELFNGETGQRVTRLDMAARRPEAPYHFLRRPDLVDVLAQGAIDAGVEIRLGEKIERVEISPDGPTLHFADGHMARPGTVLGADGLHSKLRMALNGEAKPFFTNQVAWRAMVPMTGDTTPIARVFMGAKKHLVSYPLSNGMRNIVAVEERRRWAEESWHIRDDAMTLRVAFEDFCPEVRGWLEQVEEPYLWGLFRHPVAARWFGPGCAILGDAAHPTLPFLAQGANMGLEDAWILAQALALHNEDEVAFAAYQTARIERCRAIVEAANKNARNYHLSGISRMIGHLGIRAVSKFAPDLLIGKYDWIYEYDPTQVLRAN